MDKTRRKQAICTYLDTRAAHYRALSDFLFQNPETAFREKQAAALTAEMAAHGLVIRCRGKPAHAAGSPWSGLNALDAMIQFFVGVALLRQQLKLTARLHGVITNGGAAANAIPELTEAKFLVRALDVEYPGGHQSEGVEHRPGGRPGHRLRPGGAGRAGRTHGALPGRGRLRLRLRPDAAGRQGHGDDRRRPAGPGGAERRQGRVRRRVQVGPQRARPKERGPWP